METIKEKLSRRFGYIPSESEIISLYYCGELTLSDREENAILEYIDNN